MIDCAAEAFGRTRSDFMLDTACREAQSVLLDRRCLTLSEEPFKRFTSLLDRSPKDNPKTSATPPNDSTLGPIAPCGQRPPEQLSAEYDVSAFDSGLTQRNSFDIHLLACSKLSSAHKNKYQQPLKVSVSYRCTRIARGLVPIQIFQDRRRWVWRVVTLCDAI